MRAAIFAILMLPCAVYAGSPSQNIESMGLKLTDPSPSAGAFVKVRCSGNMVYVSGHISRKEGGVWEGKLGKGATTEEGQAAARAVAVDLISTLKQHTSDIDAIKLLKVTSFVNSAPEFKEQHIVTNGASELLLEVFGENGKHARSAIGVAALPFGAMVEVELIAEATKKITCRE